MCGTIRALTVEEEDVTTRYCNGAAIAINALRYRAYAIALHAKKFQYAF